MAKQCETCKSDAVKGERYCKHCKKERLRQMKEDGYLTPKPNNSYRSSESRENVYETKHGTGHG
jgi:predicted amidophosphoribosyltransferase